MPLDTTAVKTLVSLWHDYQRECWNDSTEWVTHPDKHEWITLKEFNTHPEWKSKTYIKEIRHRPPTFDGFMTFLNDKFGIKTQVPSPISR